MTRTGRLVTTARPRTGLARLTEPASTTDRISLPKTGGVMMIAYVRDLVTARRIYALKNNHDIVSMAEKRLSSIRGSGISKVLINLLDAGAFPYVPLPSNPSSLTSVN